MQNNICISYVMHIVIPLFWKDKHQTFQAGLVNFTNLMSFYAVNCGQLHVQMLRLTVG